MVEYAKDTIIKLLRQYEMLSKSLKLINDSEQKNDICLQMTRIIEYVLKLTNDIYEKKYNKLLQREVNLMDEERNKLLEIINLINERRTYINNQINSNKEITGMDCESQTVLGEDKLSEYKNELRVIEKYKSNIKLNETLKDEIEKISISIKKAQGKIINNNSLNKQLEKRMIKTLDNAFEKLNIYELKDRSKEIDLAYTELGYSLEKAKENASIARKGCTDDIIIECDNMLASITLDYERYKEKKLLLKLLEIYKRECNNYDELLKKREEINNILINIPSSDLNKMVGEELNKEYSTIKLEKQDSSTLASLIEEKANKEKTIKEITEENNSEEFKQILSYLLENEKKYEEKLLLEKKRKEEERKIKEMLEAQKKQEEMMKRQRQIEEERKKEIEQRTKNMLDRKKNPIIMEEKLIKEEKVEEPVKKEIKKAEVEKPIIKRTNKDIIEEINSKNIENIFPEKINETQKEVNEFKKAKPIVEEKKENKFEFPSKEDSFFNDDEFEDLNKYVENSGKNWF